MTRPNYLACSFVGVLATLALVSAVSAQSSAAARSDQARPAIVGAASVTQGQIRPPRDSAGEFRPLERQEMRLLPAVLPGEVAAAPWLDELGGPSSSGMILRSAELPGVAMRPEDRRSFLPQEDLYVVPPGGSAAVGQSFLTYAMTDVVGIDGQVAVPTGVLRIVRGGAAGEASAARLVRTFGPVQASDRLVPFDSMAGARVGAPAPVANGVETTVMWIQGGSVLPTLQSYAVLGVGSAAGVRMGDVFTLLSDRVLSGEGIWIPEKEIARARVVRVTPRGTTVIVTHHTEPAIRVGVLARLTARMP